MRIDFDWDRAKAASIAAKHGVAFPDAMSVLNDSLGLSIPDPAASEERWVTLGLAATKKSLVAAHI